MELTYPSHLKDAVINKCFVMIYEDFERQFPKKELYVTKYREHVDAQGTWGIIQQGLNLQTKQLTKPYREKWKSLSKLLNYPEQKFFILDQAHYIVLVSLGKDKLIKEWTDSLLANKNK